MLKINADLLFCDNDINNKLYDSEEIMYITKMTFKLYKRFE